MPALWAVTGFSIFIASSTTTRSPAATVSPSVDRDLDDRALHRGGHRVAGRRRRRPCPPRLRAVVPRAGRRPRGRTQAEVAGQRHLEPRAADLDDDRLPRPALLLGLGAPPANGATVLSHSVSIHRVCTVNGRRR